MMHHQRPHVDRYTCEETARRLDDYLDRELTSREMEMVREHLETCAACAGGFAFEASVLAELRSKLRRIAMPVDLETRIVSALAAARLEESDD
ncbi:MAG TPA: zf-HC2 domain-containing protein [Gemmatimonadaceae bacterium]